MEDILFILWSVALALVFRDHWQTALYALYFSVQTDSGCLAELLYCDTHELFTKTLPSQLCLQNLPCY